MATERTTHDEGSTKGASFVTSPRAGEAIDNGVALLDMLLEPGCAPGFAMFVNHFPPMGGGPPAHHHNSYDEAFYVLAGEMEFCVDGETARVPAGSMAFVPRGATHAFRNPSTEPAHLLVVTTPEAIDLIVRMPEGARSPETLGALFAEHDSQVDGPPLG
ncbi:MAG: cupin domain-containing protein [Acidimicrobiales bacterium]